MKIELVEYSEKILEVAYFNFPLVKPKETVLAIVYSLIDEYADQQTKELREEIERLKEKNNDLIKKLNNSL